MARRRGQPRQRARRRFAFPHHVAARGGRRQSRRDVMATVLVVEDDAGIRESVAMALEKVGLKTVQAGDVTSALQALRAHRIDLVLSDIYMPGETGLTLLQAIAERRNPPRVILMTARGTIETTALAQRIGAFDYIAKPFDLNELIVRVRAALGDRAGDHLHGGG